MHDEWFVAAHAHTVFHGVAAADKSSDIQVVVVEAGRSAWLRCGKPLRPVQRTCLSVAFAGHGAGAAGLAHQDALAQVQSNIGQ